MAKVKKAQGGKNVPKGMVESEMFPGKMIPESSVRRGPYISTNKPTVKKSAVKKKMKGGGSLKPVDSSKNPGLAKLPTAVRNKMGYQKSGGKSFPDLTGDGKVTKADILKGRGVIKNGGKLKAKGGAALKKQAAVAIAMKKAGKSPKKAMGGMKMMKGGGKCKYGC